MKTEALLDFLAGWASGIRLHKPIVITMTQADRLDDAITTIVALHAENDAMRKTMDKLQADLIDTRHKLVHAERLLSGCA